MTEHELGLKLREMYDNAQKDESVVYIHLFGIKFADEMKELYNVNSKCRLNNLTSLLKL